MFGIWNQTLSEEFKRTVGVYGISLILRILKKCLGIWNQTNSEEFKRNVGVYGIRLILKKCWGIWNQIHSKEMLGYMESDSLLEF